MASSILIALLVLLILVVTVIDLKTDWLDDQDEDG